MTNSLEKKSSKKIETLMKKMGPLAAGLTCSVDESNFPIFCWHVETINILKKLLLEIVYKVEGHKDAATPPSILSDDIAHYNLLISDLNFQTKLRKIK